MINKSEKNELKHFLYRLQYFCKCCFFYKKINYEIDDYELDDIEYDSIYKMNKNHL